MIEVCPLEFLRTGDASSMAQQFESSTGQPIQTWQQAILDSADFTIISTDVNGIIQTLNAEAFRKLGYKPEEVIGKVTPAIIHDPQEVQQRAQQLSQELGYSIVPGFEALVAKARLGIADENVWTYIREDQSRFPVCLSVTALRDASGQLTGFLGIGKDITEQQKVEQSLLDSAARYRSLYEHTPVMLHSIDQKGRLISVSDTWLSKMGYERWEVLGRPSIEFLSAASQDFAQEVLSQYFQTGFCQDIPYQFVQKNGEILDVLLSAIAERDADGQICHTLAVSIDVTERKRMETALHTSEKRLRLALAFDNAAVGKILVALDGTFLRVNKAICEIVGYSKSELLALTLPVITHSEDLDLDLGLTRQLLAGEIDTYQIEKRFIHKQGHTIWILLSISLAQGEADQPRYFSIQVQDISQRQEAEATLKRLNSDLELLVRERTSALENAIRVAELANSAKSQFLANMSHELRTPLNVILGFSQLMVQDEALPLHLQKSLEIINQSGEHLLALINDVLTLTKIEAGKTILQETTFDLLELLSSLQNMLQMQAQSQETTLQLECAIEVPQFVYADEGKLRQVLLNLLSNALKFTQKGEVILRVQLESQNISSSPPTYLLSFDVEDTGIGIGPEDLEKVFESFIQTETGQQMQDGTGLGLPISRKFVQLMGGTMSVTSQLGEGTCFHFYIQAQLPDEVPTSRQSRQGVKELAAQHPCYRILVVEDHLENQQLLVDLLTPLGHDIRAVKDGQAAVTLWRTWQPHLIWMDINLPEMNGLKATRQIKSLAASENLSPPIIIALTASALEYTKSEALESGCDDFVSKPYVLTDLLEIMTQYLKTQHLSQKSQLLPSHSDSTVILTPNLLQELSAEWRQQLYQAALHLDKQRIIGLIDQIEPEHCEIAKGLANFVNNFQFDRIINLTQNKQVTFDTATTE